MQCHNVFFPEAVIALFSHADEGNGGGGKHIDGNVGKAKPGAERFNGFLKGLQLGRNIRYLQLRNISPYVQWDLRQDCVKL